MGIECDLNLSNMSEVTLKGLQEFYIQELMNNTYKYDYDYKEINDKVDEVSKIHLHFYESNMCHLLGIQHIVDSLYNKNTYTGELGFNKIKDDELTIDILKSISKSKFKSQKDRFKYFKLIKNIIESPDLILYNSNKNKSNIKSKYIMYKLIGNSYVHLGIDVKECLNVDGKLVDICFPRTFLIEKKLGMKFIENQTELVVKSSEIVDK
ncbi:TPA: hypothetical protein ACF2DM_003047 [Clostridium perfringens]